MEEAKNFSGQDRTLYVFVFSNCALSTKADMANGMAVQKNKAKRP